jgi:hypothetical protein
VTGGGFGSGHFSEENSPAVAELAARRAGKDGDEDVGGGENDDDVEIVVQDARSRARRASEEGRYALISREDSLMRQDLAADDEGIENSGPRGGTREQGRGLAPLESSLGDLQAQGGAAWSFGEKAVLGHAIGLVGLWFLRSGTSYNEVIIGLRLYRPSHLRPSL